MHLYSGILITALPFSLGVPHHVKSHLVNNEAAKVLKERHHSKGHDVNNEAAGVLKEREVEVNSDVGAPSPETLTKLTQTGLSREQLLEVLSLLSPFGGTGLGTLGITTKRDIAEAPEDVLKVRQVPSLSLTDLGSKLPAQELQVLSVLTGKSPEFLKTQTILQIFQLLISQIPKPPVKRNHDQVLDTRVTIPLSTGPLGSTLSPQQLLQLAALTGKPTEFLQTQKFSQILALLPADQLANLNSLGLGALTGGGLGGLPANLPIIAKDKRLVGPIGDLLQQLGISSSLPIVAKDKRQLGNLGSLLGVLNSLGLDGILAKEKRGLLGLSNFISTLQNNVNDLPLEGLLGQTGIVA
ncbi:hypothetical protein B0O99DRAFT_600014 [Bisporella sp. PMI_857]|nr:hypothetical protein B0O99DRAFT_600014 [Bisporella sp. PMI_857]